MKKICNIQDERDFGKMKKVLKSFLWCAGGVLFCLVSWFCFLYVTNYKVTTCDTAVSPDGVYQLALQSIGELDFPFGASEGRCYLKKVKLKFWQ